MAEHARAVIIGGGVGGTSIAYHLAKGGEALFDPDGSRISA
jgi:glycine/D-amino acid oxidase-like deaminating enzyme